MTHGCATVQQSKCLESEVLWLLMCLLLADSFKRSRRARISNWFHMQRRPAPGERCREKTRREMLQTPPSPAAAAFLELAGRSVDVCEGSTFPHAFACVKVCRCRPVQAGIPGFLTSRNLESHFRLLDGKFNAQ